MGKIELTCPNCSSGLREVEVKVYGIKKKVISYQCPECDYFEFENTSSKKIVRELRPEFVKKMQNIMKEKSIRVDDFEMRYNS